VLEPATRAITLAKKEIRARFPLTKYLRFPNAFLTRSVVDWNVAGGSEPSAWRVVMTFFVAFFVICFVAVLGVFWCLWGFSRELQRSRRTIGFVVRVQAGEMNASPKNDSPVENVRRNMPKVVAFPSPSQTTLSGTSRRSGQAGRKVMSLAGLMVLAGSWSTEGSASKPRLADVERRSESTHSLRVEIAGVTQEIQPLTTLIYDSAS